MRQLVMMLLLAAAPVMPSFAFENMSLLERLDSVMADCGKYMTRKEARIKGLKSMAAAAREDTLRLRLYDEIYTQYYTYRFDSAMVYVDRSAKLAARTGNVYYATLATIHRSVLLATSGLYSEAIDNLNTLDEKTMSDELLFVCYFAYAWTYNYRVDYCADSVYAPRYMAKKVEYIQKAVPLAPNANAKEYLTAEALYTLGHYQESYDHYMKSFEGLPVDTRLYAMVTYAIARYHLMTGDIGEYERFLVLAAISDIVCPLKENMAMQELAMYLYRTSPGELRRANSYINYSMNDALFYNNRLRIIEISNKLPVIVSSYQQHNDRQSRRLLVMLVCISVLSVCLVVSLFFLRKQLRLSHAQRRELSQGNERLSELNAKLRDTNTVRENYMRLFLDLCAAYIDKLGKYRDFVHRKIKAKQVEDLLKASYTTRLTEQEAVSFFMSFDAAFLELYPDFIDQFNNLLREDARIVPKKRGSLTTALRIFALIRLGVKDSSEISTLLFYSPQTIYNYRSSMKNNAINRDTFEEDVAKLCALM